MRISYLIISGALFIAACKSNTESKDASSMTADSEQTVTPKNENIAASSTNNGEVAAIKFKEDNFDFGTIKQGEKVKHTFEFTNTGKAPLIIQNASASCGCTVPDWPHDPIQPGESSKIEVEFNSAGKKGPQSKSVSITANTDPSITTLRFVAVVEGGEDSK
jgi:hypothetical protein